MNKKIRSLVVGAMVCAMGMSTTIMGATPYVSNDTEQVMVPVREVAENLGFAVAWDGTKQQVSLENGSTKMTFQIGQDAYQKSSGRLSGECIMMYVPKELGEAAVIKDGMTYVPATLFDYALDKTEVLTVEENEVVIKEDVQVSYYKEHTIQLGEHNYSMSINLPDYIGPYVTLTSEITGTGSMQYPLIFLKFVNTDGTSNIGTFSIFTPEQYEAVENEGGPMPTKVLETKAYVICFTGLHDMPFELGTKAAELVGAYHEGVGEILKTVTLKQE